MQITPYPTLHCILFTWGQVYANYFLPVHQKPMPINPMPRQKQKNPDSKQLPISTPTPKAINAQPQS